eukprot:361632-Chlamydomonas_euryale.AAC.5
MGTSIGTSAQRFTRTREFPPTHTEHIANNEDGCDSTCGNARAAVKECARCAKNALKPFLRRPAVMRPGLASQQPAYLIPRWPPTVERLSLASRRRLTESAAASRQAVSRPRLANTRPSPRVATSARARRNDNHARVPMPFAPAFDEH